MATIPQPDRFGNYDPPDGYVVVWDAWSQDDMFDAPGEFVEVFEEAFGFAPVLRPSDNGYSVRVTGGPGIGYPEGHKYFDLDAWLRNPNMVKVLEEVRR